MAAKLEAHAVGTSSLRRTVPELCRETRESVSPAAAARFAPSSPRARPPDPTRRRRRGRRVARGGDRRRAPARAVVRGVDRSSGPTRSRRCSWRCRRATGSAGASPTATRRWPGCRRSCSARRRCWRSSPSSPGRSCASPSTRSTASQAGAFVGSLLAVLLLVAAPVLLLGAVAPYAVRLSVRTVEEAGRVAGRLYAISTLGQPGRGLPQRAGARPVRGHAAHVPGLRPVAGDRRRARAGAALRARPDRARRADRDPGRHGQGDRRREGDLGARRPSTSTPGSCRRTTASAASSSTRARRSTPIYRPGDVADRRLLGRDARAALRRRRAARRGRWRSSATPRARRPAPTATTSRATRVDAVEIDGGADRRRAAPVRPPRPEPPPPHGRRAAVPAPRRRAATTSSSSTPTASPTSRSTSPRASSSRSRASTSRRGGDDRHQRRPPRALRPPREGADRDDGRGARGPCARPERADEHDARGDRRAGLGRRAAAPRPPRLPGDLQPVADGDGGAAGGAAARAGGSTRTTWRRSSG